MVAKDTVLPMKCLSLMNCQLFRKHVQGRSHFLLSGVTNTSSQCPPVQTPRSVCGCELDFAVVLWMIQNSMYALDCGFESRTSLLCVGLVRGAWGADCQMLSSISLEQNASSILPVDQKEWKHTAEEEEEPLKINTFAFCGNWSQNAEFDLFLINCCIN